ncbi:MAG: hypothetical protein AAFP26_11075, partial [Planctomycetota bacterium]
MYYRTSCRFARGCIGVRVAQRTLSTTGGMSPGETQPRQVAARLLTGSSWLSRAGQQHAERSGLNHRFE